MNRFEQNRGGFDPAMFGRVSQQIQGASVTRTNAFLRSVWGWMGGGLAVTSVLAVAIGTNEALFNMVAPMLMPLVLVELGLVLFLSFRVHKMSAATATGSFVGYAALNGIVLSSIFAVYNMPSITGAFFAASGTFVGMSVYGMVTKRDLSQWRSFLMMGLIGIVIASIVNIFLASDAVYWVTTYAGVLVFTGLTAYDTQKILHMGYALEGQSGGDIRKFAIMGALSLYLDFINLFLFMLRIFAGRND